MFVDSRTAAIESMIAFTLSSHPFQDVAFIGGRVGPSVDGERVEVITGEDVVRAPGEGETDDEGEGELTTTGGTLAEPLGVKVVVAVEDVVVVSILGVWVV